MTTPVGYEGEPLTLTDGRTVRLRFGMREIMLLEQRFGSLAALQTAINADGTGPVYKPGLDFISAGLVREAGTDAGPLSNPEVLADRLDPYVNPEGFQQAITAAGKALAAAFPQAAQDAATTETTAPDDPSRGATGTTSAPSPSAAPTTSSG